MYSRDKSVELVGARARVTTPNDGRGLASRARCAVVRGCARAVVIDREQACGDLAEAGGELCFDDGSWREKRERRRGREGALRLPYGISQGLIATCLRRGTDILRRHLLIETPAR